MTKQKDTGLEGIPPTEPVIDTPAVVQEPPRPEPTVSGADLAPDPRSFGTVDSALAVGEFFYYWVGSVPDCPMEYPTFAGIVFPKVNERLVKSHLRDGKTNRVPVIGGIAKIDRLKFLRLVDTIKRTVIRFQELPEEVPENNPLDDKFERGKNLEDIDIRPRRGRPILIPTKEEIEQAKQMNRHIEAYIPSERDEPIARYLFAVLCQDQRQPERGDKYPGTMAQDGFYWPGKEA